MNELFVLFADFSPYEAVLLGTGLTCFATALGASFVFFLGRNPNPTMKSLTLGFAAGIKIAASVWSLLIPAIEQAEELGQNGLWSAAGGFILGALFLALLDKLLPHLHEPDAEPEGPKTNFRRTTLLVSSVTLHNIPEGMSLGLTFAIAAMQNDPLALSGAFALALGMAIQNIPEGTAVALPLHECGWSKRKAFLAGVASGLVEPIFGLLTVVIIGFVAPYLPWLLAFAAGAMMYVVVEELIPAAKLNEHSDAGTIAVLCGFVLMMMLDVALG